jgi:phosphoribosylformimino-5-aminoimidazole carboxamide ribotide isomerase
MANAMDFEILPAIDLRGGRVVRLRQGDFERETAYDRDPADVASGFAAAGAMWLHVVDLDGARTGVPEHGKAIAAIVAAAGERTRVEVAGGLRDERAVAAALDSGAARAVVGTAALQDPAFARHLVDVHGAGRVAVAIDVRDGLAVGHGWAVGHGRSTGADGIEATDAIRQLANAGIETFEVTAIERDGLLEGPNLALYERLVHLGRGAIIASGGIASLADVLAVRDLGCSGAIIGRAIYEGRIDLSEALAITAAAGGPEGTTDRSGRPGEGRAHPG